MSATTGRLALAVAALLASAAGAKADPIVTRSLQAVLSTGKLAGTSFIVRFSYDAGQATQTGDSYLPLITFDFSLLGVPFSRHDIFQGGEVILHNGRFDNVTASFQVILPPKSPVNNITFGFGGAGVIGYVDLDGETGEGWFAIVRFQHPRR